MSDRLPRPALIAALLLGACLIAAEAFSGYIYAFQQVWIPTHWAVPLLLFLAYMIGVAAFDRERE